MQFRTIVKFSVGIIVYLLAYAVCAQAGWQFITPMPHGRYGHDATLGPDGKIYVMGGLTSIKTNDGRYSNLVYDPQKNSWTYLMPVPGWIVTDYIVTFDTEIKRWKWIKKGSKQATSDITRNTDLQREGVGVAVVTGNEGSIYWLGGRGKWLGYGENIVLPFDPIKATWPEAVGERVNYSASAYGIKTVFKTDVPPMLERRVFHEAVVSSDGKIYVMGGMHDNRIEDSHGNVYGSGSKLLNSMECYDPVTKCWEYKKPMSSKRMVFAAAAGPDDKIYVFGGAAGLYESDSTPILKTTEVYDPGTDTWTARKPMPRPRDSHAAVLGKDGKIYILGGTSGPDTSPLKEVLIYDPVRDTWVRGPDMQFPRANIAAVATAEKIYAIGGTDMGAYKTKEKLNTLLPKSQELYTGKIQDTVEVLDILK